MVVVVVDDVDDDNDEETAAISESRPCIKTNNGMFGLVVRAGW